MTQLLVALVATAAALLVVVGATVIEADYVIVGGGTAGCALAARLCEGLPHASVVLLERGTPRSEEQETGVRAIRLMFSNLDDPEIVESFLSEPNPALNDREFDIRVGNTLGGTSAIAGMQFSRPTVETITSWGLTGLDADTADRLFEKVKAQTQAGPQPDDLKMTYLDEWLEAHAIIGVPVVEEGLMGEATDGVWEALSMVDDQGRRQDSAYAYLRPVMGPEGACSSNLQVVQGATASKILLEGTKAIGVQFLRGNDSSAIPEVVTATQEVVLSAGAYGSPKLLMSYKPFGDCEGIAIAANGESVMQLSGIGPAETLSEFGIPLYADLPVGQDAQERPFAPNAFLYEGMPVPPEAMTDLVLSPEAEAVFEAGDGGLLGTTPAMSTGVWGPPIGSWRGAAMMPYDVTLGTPENFGITACDLNPDPQSRATVTLNSTDVFESPVVDLNLLAQPEELTRMVLCYHREREVYDGLREQGFNITELLPGVDTPLEDAAMTQAMNAGNFVGSCGIGRVLDADLKVIGFENLRVVDASAIPDVPYNSGPLATTFMLGEYAAEQLIMNGPYTTDGKYGTSADGEYGDL